MVPLTSIYSQGTQAFVFVRNGLGDRSRPRCGSGRRTRRTRRCSARSRWGRTCCCSSRGRGVNSWSRAGSSCSRRRGLGICRITRGGSILRMQRRRRRGWGRRSWGVRSRSRRFLQLSRDGQGGMVTDLVKGDPTPQESAWGRFWFSGFGRGVLFWVVSFISIGLAVSLAIWKGGLVGPRRVLLRMTPDM